MIQLRLVAEAEQVEQAQHMDVHVDVPTPSTAPRLLNINGLDGSTFQLQVDDAVTVARRSTNERRNNFFFRF